MIEITAVDTVVSALSRTGTVKAPIHAGTYIFGEGINILVGSIESGNVGISYVLSGGCKLSGCTVTLDGKKLSAGEISAVGCFVGHPPRFAGNTCIKRLIERGIRKSRNVLSFDDIAAKFLLTPERVQRRFAYQGNERYRASIAIGYAAGKRIYCTEYISSEMWLKYYHIVLKPYLEILRDEGMTVIVPAESADDLGGFADNIYCL